MKLFVVVLLCVSNIQAAPPPAAVAETADLAVNMKKFQEVYSLATQLMNLGGNILNNANGGTGSSSAPSSSRLSSISSDYSSSSGNGILGEVVRPQFRGVSNYEPSAERSNFGSGGLSEYGGGLLGAGSKSQPRSIMDTLLGSFLGSSLGSGSGSSSSSGAASIFQPSYEEYGESNSKFGGPKGSNIEAIVDALSRGGAKRATPEPDAGLNAGSLISQFFGGGR
ncbi:unnamed protein product [Bursaphelenchus okinawaensis]|uniref:Uncharacterized protein n=1 Tax=Bursaphelenchus okinawaensis TaxID=465554 RepID=A0A811LPV0_9BILA|nr:unnamed protein product [Bursaphelenchus okinawaensis]CAG9125961.1 unnamed protein product [Bursaphelenchus okinawaensis]